MARPLPLQGEGQLEESLPPRTMDVLGEHLHCKVTQLISTMASDPQRSKICLQDGQLCSQVTGMLLETTETQVRQMLQRDGLLSKVVAQAIQCLADQWAEPNHHDKEGEGLQIDEGFHYDQLADQLFDKVSALENKFTAEITGMLLELDPRALITLVQDRDDLLATAVAKARKALEMELSTQPTPAPENASEMELSTQLTPAPGKASEMELITQPTPAPELHQSSVTSPSDGHCNDGLQTEEVGEMGMKIYSLAESLHGEAASAITGMILEMEPNQLKAVMSDPALLETAIGKAYNAWTQAS